MHPGVLVLSRYRYDLCDQDAEGRILPDPTLIQVRFPPGTLYPLHVDVIFDPCLPNLQQLRPGHKIARGRGRKKQLETMTELEKLAENAAKMEKMRISARECRLRKKNRTKAVEDEVKRYEDAEVKNRAEIRALEARMNALQVCHHLSCESCNLKS